MKCSMEKRTMAGMLCSEEGATVPYNIITADRDRKLDDTSNRIKLLQPQRFQKEDSTVLIISWL